MGVGRTELRSQRTKLGGALVGWSPWSPANTAARISKPRRRRGANASQRPHPHAPRPGLDARDQIRQNRLRLKITGLLWLEDVVEKLARKHQVEIEEVEELFRGKPRFRFVERGHREGENVYAALGQTDAGRYLIVFFVWKADGYALPISARDMKPSERNIYGRK